MQLYTSLVRGENHIRDVYLYSVTLRVCNMNSRGANEYTNLGEFLLHILRSALLGCVALHAYS